MADYCVIAVLVGPSTKSLGLTAYGLFIFQQLQTIICVARK
jgi:hypothetical protein